MPKLSASLIHRLFMLVLALALLPACSSRIAAMNQTAGAFLFGEADPSATATLNPGIRYLRVEINDRVVLLALGYLDAHPLGIIEVWYSAKGEVLRLQNGHVVGLTGADIEWREARLSTLPVWPANTATPSHYTRTRDIMPGYRFGVVDRLSLRAVDAPARSRLVSVAPSSLRWFEAHELTGALPPSRFAVSTRAGQEVAIYGEQCITSRVCLSWQQWPPVASAP